MRPPPQKMDPIVFLVGGALLVLCLVVAGIYLLPSGDDLVRTKYQIEKMAAEGNRLYRSDRFREAIAAWEEGIALCDGPELRSLKTALEQSVRLAREAMSEREDARKEWEDFRKESSPLPETETASREEYTSSRNRVYSLLQRAEELEKRHARLRVAWMTSAPGKKSGELPEIRIRLETRWNEIVKIENGLTFRMFQRKVRNTRLRSDKPDWAAAIREWKRYLLDVRVSPPDLSKAENEVESVNRRAKGAWRQLKSRSDRMEKASAIRMLTDALPRFEGCIFADTDLAAEIRKKIRELGP